MLNIIIYFPGSDSFSDRNLLGETVALVGALVRGNEGGELALHLGLWAGQAL